MPYLLDFDGSFCLLPSPSYHFVTQGAADFACDNQDSTRSIFGKCNLV